MSGFGVEALFDVKDLATAKLNALIIRLEKAQIQLDKCSISMMELGSSAEFAAMGMTKLNMELTRGSRTMTGLVSRSEKVALGFDSMSNASRKAYGSFVQTNIQMQEMVLSAKEAQAAMHGLNTSMNATPAGRRATAAAGGSGGGGGGKSGPTFIGGLGGFVSKAMIGMIGFDMAKAAMNPAMELQQQEVGLKAMGLSTQQVKRAENQSGAMQRNIKGTNKSENLQQIKELYGIFRDFNEAIELAPAFAKFNIALEGVGNRMPSMKGHEQGYAQSVAKSAETLGRLQPKEFEKFLNTSLQSYEATGGLVTPLHTAQAIKFSRAGRYGKNDDWNFGVLSFLLEEAALGKGGGGSRGVGPLVTGLDRTFGVGGKMDKRLVQNFSELGLFEGVKPGTKSDKLGLSTTTMSTGVTQKLKNQSLMIENPYEWFRTQFYPAMFKAEKISKDQFDALPQNKKAEMIKTHTKGMQQLVGDAVLQFGINGNQIDKFVTNLKHASDVQTTYNEVIKTTAMKSKAAGQELYTLTQTIGIGLSPAVNSLMDGISGLLHSINGMSTQMPLTNQAFGQFNEKLFGAQGAFSKMGESLGKISESAGPFLQILDKAAAFGLGGVGDSFQSYAKGLGSGAKKAQEREKRTGLPAILSLPLMLKEAESQIYADGLQKVTRPAWKATRKAGEAFYGDVKKGAGKVGDAATNAGMEAVGKAGDYIMNFNIGGAVVGLNDVIDAVKRAVAGAMSRQAHAFQGTTSTAGGNYNNKPFGG